MGRGEADYADAFDITDTAISKQGGDNIAGDRN